MSRSGSCTASTHQKRAKTSKARQRATKNRVMHNEERNEFTTEIIETSDANIWTPRDSSPIRLSLVWSDLCRQLNTIRTACVPSKDKELRLSKPYFELVELSYRVIASSNMNAIPAMALFVPSRSCRFPYLSCTKTVYLNISSFLLCVYISYAELL